MERRSMTLGTKMVRSDKAGAGVMFSVDTETGFDKVVVINAAWGLLSPEQKTGASQEFIDFANNTSTFTTGLLLDARDTVVQGHTAIRR